MFLQFLGHSKHPTRISHYITTTTTTHPTSGAWMHLSKKSSLIHRHPMVYYVSNISIIIPSNTYKDILM